MTLREIKSHEVFQSEKKYGCRKELEALKQCWEQKGADIHDRGYKCGDFELIYMSCMETTGNLDPLSGRGVTASEFGGENVYSFMFKVTAPFRVLSHHPVVNALGDIDAYHKGGNRQNDPNKITFRTRGLRTSKYRRDQADWKRRLNYRKETCGKGTRLQGR